MMEAQRKKQRFSDNRSDDPTSELDRRGGHEGTQRPPGMYTPKEADKPVTIVAFEFGIFRKFQSQSIVVDGSPSTEPTKVWFLPHADIDECKMRENKENFFQVNYLDDCAGNTPVWFSSSRIPSSVDRNDLETVMNMFQDMSFCLKWHRSRKPEELRWESITEQRLGHAQLITDMVTRDPWLVTTFASGRFLRAFRKGMSDSAGTSALTAILLLAGQLVYGKNCVCLEEIDCYSVGSDPKEWFPIKQAPPEFLNGSRQRPDRSKTPSDLPDVELGDSASVYASRSRKKSDSATSSNAGVYFMSGAKPNWPHFVFVGKVQKGHEELAGAATYQLLKDMMGPMMRQSLVFGILMNATKATLCTMEQDFSKKQINVSFQYYDFLCNKDFKFDQLKLMFLDILCAMKFNQDNIKEIDRGF